MTAPISTLIALDRELRLVCGRPSISAWADQNGWRSSVIDMDREPGAPLIGMGSGSSLADAVTAAVLDFRDQLARQQVEALQLGEARP